MNHLDALDKKGVVMGYCGICNQHYEGNFVEHGEECEGRKPPIEQGSVEDFEKQVKDFDLDEEQSEELWNKYFR
jgi:hypothetical protein